MEPSTISQQLTSGMREGEALALAIEDANRKARAARAKATEFLAEAEKWEAIAADLQSVNDKVRTPASALKPRPPASTRDPSPARERRPRGFWSDAVVEIMRAFPAAVVGPTKSEVYRCLRKRYPEELTHTIYVAVSRALVDGVVVKRGSNLFLPENDPQKKHPMRLADGTAVA